MQIVAVTAPLNAIINMEIACANAQVRHIIGNLATHVKSHAPVEGLNFFVADLARPACVLAARQAQRRQRLRTADHVLDGADLLNMPVVHHADALAQAARFVDVVAHVEHGAVAYIEQVEHVLLEGALKIGIECAHGLVEHKDARMRRHHASKRHALLLTAREARGIAVGKIGQTENAQIALGEFFARGGVTRVLYTGAYVIGHRHVGKQLIVLEQQGAFSLLGRQVDARRRVKKGHAVDNDLSLVGRLNTGNAAQCAALAAT